MFSTYTLLDILPQHDFQCLRKFVIACTYICNSVLTDKDIIVTDNLLMQFCNSFENLYGKESITPNMHLDGHLKECMLLDYGPVYSFWLFSFERYNGLLGSSSTNRRKIELQFMKRFVRDLIIITKDFWDVSENIFAPLINSMTKGGDRTTLNEIRKSDILPLKLSSWVTDFTKVSWCVSDEIKLSGTKTKCILDEIKMHCLTCFY